MFGYSLYFYRRVFIFEVCEEVYRILMEMYGEVKQLDRIFIVFLEIVGCGEVFCVFDVFLCIFISGNILMVMVDVVIRNLGKDFGICIEGSGVGSIDWEKVWVLLF